MFFKHRAHAAGWHLLAGATLVGAVAISAVFAWFPYPYYWVSGGVGLFGLIAAVDVILGPLLTFTVFNRAKPVAELRRDLAVVVILQLAALSYGVWTLALARPVYLVHEVDRFQVVTAADARSQLATQLAAGVHPPSWRGGWQVLGVRMPVSEDEKLASIDAALSGLDVGLRAGWWIPLNFAHIAELQKRGRPLDSFLARHPELAEDVNQQLAKMRVSRDQIRVYPLIGRIDTWSLMFDLKQRAVVGYLPVDGF